MLNFGSKPSQDASLRKIAIWGDDLVLCNAPKFGPHPGGSYGGQGGLSFYVGGKGRQLTQISHRKLKNSISHSMVIWEQEPEAMLMWSVRYLNDILIIFGDRDIHKSQCLLTCLLCLHFDGKLSLFHAEVSFDTSKEKQLSYFQSGYFFKILWWFHEAHNWVKCSR